MPSSGLSELSIYTRAKTEVIKMVSLYVECCSICQHCRSSEYDDYCDVSGHIIDTETETGCDYFEKL